MGGEEELKPSLLLSSSRHSSHSWSQPILRHLAGIKGRVGLAFGEDWPLFQQPGGKMSGKYHSSSKNKSRKDVRVSVHRCFVFPKVEEKVWCSLLEKSCNIYITHTPSGWGQQKWTCSLRPMCRMKKHQITCWVFNYSNTDVSSQSFLPFTNQTFLPVSHISYKPTN